MTLYLNKKIGDMRGRSGVSELPRSVLTNTVLSIKPKVKAEASNKKL
jgi:hypothetical protein